MPSPQPTNDEQFLTTFSRLITAAVPSTATNPHCISLHRLFNLFGQVRKEGIETRRNQGGIIQWLERIGIIKKIDVVHYSAKIPRRTQFYSIGIGAQSASGVSPFELLQAYHENGVICYFSAIAFYSLTTQPPSHHHIALRVVREETTETDKQQWEQPRSDQKEQATPATISLGTRLFQHHGLDYYKTERTARLIPGVVRRLLDASVMIQVTTLEQTLLDTLHRPLSCGGAAVVQEVWQSGLARLNVPKLITHLIEMNSSPIIQRLGYLLEYHDYQPSADLASLLEKYVAQLDPQNETCHRQLFPGIEYSTLHPKWLVYGP